MMSYRRFCLSSIVAALLCCGATLYAQSAPAAPPADGERLCVVRGILGDVSVRRNPAYNKVRRERSVMDKSGAPAASRDTGSGEWAPARLNMHMREKDEIKTGPQSEARFETPEGTIVKLGENTSAEIAILRHGADARRKPTAADIRDGVTNTKIKINDGSVISNIKKPANSRSNFRFETATAMAAIRGTVVEFEVRKNTYTEIKVFDGSIFVAPAGSEQFVEVGDGKMVELVPGQKAVIVKDIPKGYKRKSFWLRGEKDPNEKPARRSKADPDKGGRAGAAPADSDAVKLTLDLGDEKDTVNCYARDTIIIEGLVQPADARVSVNGVAAQPDESGAFKITIAAPADSGVYPITITAKDGEVSETVIRVMNVAHVHTNIRLTAPIDGQIVDKPSVTVSGTAPPGSRVNTEGAAIQVKRDGTFSGEAPLPDKEGEIKIHVEIIGQDDNAVWIERNIIYRK